MKLSSELVGSGGGVVEGTLPIEVVLALYGGGGACMCECSGVQVWCTSMMRIRGCMLGHDYNGVQEDGIQLLVVLVLREV